MGTDINFLSNYHKLCTYRFELDLVVGLDAIAKLESGGVLATGSLVDLDFIASEEVFLP